MGGKKFVCLQIRMCSLVVLCQRPKGLLFEFLLRLLGVLMTNLGMEPWYLPSFLLRRSLPSLERIRSDSLMQISKKEVKGIGITWFSLGWFNLHLVKHWRVVDSVGFNLFCSITLILVFFLMRMCLLFFLINEKMSSVFLCHFQRHLNGLFDVQKEFNISQQHVSPPYTSLVMVVRGLVLVLKDTHSREEHDCIYSPYDVKCRIEMKILSIMHLLHPIKLFEVGIWIT